MGTRIAKAETEYPIRRRKEEKADFWRVAGGKVPQANH